MNKQSFKVKNMHCASCASLIELELEDIGIAAKCSYTKQTLEIVDNGADFKKIQEAVKKAGYELAI